MTMQPCGVAKLLSAAFGIPLVQAYDVVGLEPCPQCGKAGTNPEYYPFCTKICQKRHVRRPSTVDLICDTCGVTFTRKVSVIIGNSKSRAGKPKRGVFCSYRCHGVVAAREAGFLAHPENVMKGAAARRNQTHCKRGHPFNESNTYLWRNRRACRICRDSVLLGSRYNAAEIWAKHLATGFGAIRLARFFDCSATTISKVLATYRREKQ